MSRGPTANRVRQHALIERHISEMRRRASSPRRAHPTHHISRDRPIGPASEVRPLGQQPPNLIDPARAIAQADGAETSFDRLKARRRARAVGEGAVCRRVVARAGARRVHTQSRALRHTRPHSPRCRRDVAEMSPRYRRDVAEKSPRYRRDVADMSPICRRYVADMSPRCRRDVAVVHTREFCREMTPRAAACIATALATSHDSSRGRHVDLSGVPSPRDLPARSRPPGVMVVSFKLKIA